MVKFIIRRIWKFDYQDWKHCRWLVKEMFVALLCFDAESYLEAKALLHLHLFYDHN